jgi:serine/threonine protein kinase
MSLNRFTNGLVHIDDYEMLEQIGYGSYGDVFKVRNKETGKVFAMKESNKKELSVSDLKYMIGEIVTLYLIDHPAVLSLGGFAFPSKEHGSLILTDFLAGGSLDDHIVYNKKEPDWLDATQKMIIMVGITAGIAHLHSMKIIHRDLKPANILLTDDHLPMIADFGLARFFRNANDLGTQCGTEPYMAPEVFMGVVPNEFIDIYSLGFIFYELLTHEDPFKKARSMSDILRGKRSSFPLDFNPSLKKLISSLWAVKAKDRPTAYIVFQLLKQKKFWLEGTDETRYMKYYNELAVKTEPNLPPEIKIMKKIASSGDPLEQYNLAKFYMNPDFNETMDSDALYYLEESATSEFPPAMYEFALKIKESDPERSFKILENAAQKLYLPALYMSGIYTCTGIGTEAQPVKGREILVKAGKLGYNKAYVELFEMKAYGKHNTSIDILQAKEFFDMINESKVDPERYERMKERILEMSSKE